MTLTWRSFRKREIRIRRFSLDRLLLLRWLDMFRGVHLLLLFQWKWWRNFPRRHYLGGRWHWIFLHCLRRFVLKHVLGHIPDFVGEHVLFHVTLWKKRNYPWCWNYYLAGLPPCVSNLRRIQVSWVAEKLKDVWTCDGQIFVYFLPLLLHPGYAPACTSRVPEIYTFSITTS